MEQQSVVKISRHWHNPTISVTVDQEHINLKTPIDDYLQAVVAEIGNPTFLVTKAQLLKKLRAASESVRLKVQQASV